MEVVRGEEVEIKRGSFTGYGLEIMLTCDITIDGLIIIKEECLEVGTERTEPALGEEV